MFLNEEEQNKISKNKTSLYHKKRKKIPRNNNYFFKYSCLPNGYKNEDRVSLTEHSNILSEYQEELKFLTMKRKNIIPNTIKDNQNNNSNVIICVKNQKSDKKRDKNDNKISKEQKNKKNKNNKNEDVIKISQLYNLYHYLFIKSGLDCTKPSRFVDYLSNEISVNTYKDKQNFYKISFEDIKQNILNLDNKDPENVLIKNIVNEYYHCNFKNSIIEKIIKKINKYLINQDNNNIELKNNELNIMNDTKSMSINDICDKSSKIKKEKISHSNLLVEKLNNNNYQSYLSLTNDSNYLKCIIYISNKYLINNNKNYITDKNILKSLEDNKKLIKSFKEENKEQSNKSDKKYLNELLSNKNLKRYIKNKLICTKQCFNNQILKKLDKDNFNKVINILINYKIEEKKNREIFNDLQLSEKTYNNEISLFLILLCLIFNLINANKYPNDLAKNDLNILNQIIKYFKQNDIISDSKIHLKKKLNIKKIKREKKEKNNNKIRIKIENNKEFSLDKSVSLEERKIEESNKESKIIKIFLDSNNDFNDNRGNVNNNENYNNNESINDLMPIKFPISNNENNNENNKNNSKDEDSNFNLMERIKNIQLKMKIKSKNNFKKNLLNELNLGNDIFKLKCPKFKNRKGKQEIKEKKEEEIDNENTINYNEEDKKIKNENNIGKTIITKKGTKIIIYDDFSEENKNDSGGGDYAQNFKDNNIYKFK